MSEATPKPRIISAAIGRRKQAIASARLISGDGSMIVNDKPISEYFRGQLSQNRYELPFQTLNLTKYSATIRVHGGGKASQLIAVVLSLSRALSEIKAENKTALRTADLMTRDSRKRQRRMVGMGGKARRRKQSPKR